MMSLIPLRTVKTLAPAGRDPFLSLHREMNRLFDDVFHGVAPAGAARRGFAGFHPSLDVRETEDTVSVTAELPGVAETDFEVHVHEGVFTLKGEKRSEHENEDAGVRYRETRTGAFERTVALPAEVTADEAKARFKDGVLTVTLPKVPDTTPTPHRIEVAVD